MDNWQRALMAGARATARLEALMADEQSRSEVERVVASSNPLFASLGNRARCSAIKQPRSERKSNAALPHDVSRFKRLYPNGRAVIRQDAETTVGYISTLELCPPAGKP